MNELQNKINEAYKLISAVSVSGDNVELMAAAKESMRQAFKLAETEEPEDGR